MPTEYPLNKIRTPLGIVADPTIPVEVSTTSGYRFFDFLLDTGADCSILITNTGKSASLKFN